MLQTLTPVNSKTTKDNLLYWVCFGSLSSSDVRKWGSSFNYPYRLQSLGLKGRESRHLATLYCHVQQSPTLYPTHPLTGKSYEMFPAQQVISAGSRKSYEHYLFHVRKLTMFSSHCDACTAADDQEKGVLS